jgi:hypothetical protein
MSVIWVTYSKKLKTNMTKSSIKFYPKSHIHFLHNYHLNKLRNYVKMYGGTKVKCVCFYLSRAHEILCCVHELLSRGHELLSRGHEIVKSWERDNYVVRTR